MWICSEVDGFTKKKNVSNNGIDMGKKKKLN